MPRFSWTQKQDFGPKSRTGHAMAYDPDRKQTVLFGGDAFSNGLFNDTWEWDGNFWTQVADMGLSARRYHAMTYDAARKKTTVFGGVDNNKHLGDTWVWDGEDWTQLSNSGPQPRSGHALVYNSTQQKIILFGGETDLGVVADTWEFDGEEWTQVADTGPSPRQFHAMAYDSTRDRVVLFGGTQNLPGLGDTWEWNGTAWIQTADFGPLPCLDTAMVFTNSRCALFGGIDTIDSAAGHNLLGNSWEWDGKHWTQRQDIGPNPRYTHAMCYDTGRKTIVLFGGLSFYANRGDANANDALLADTWEHLDNATPAPQPTPNPQPSLITITSFTLTPNVVSASPVSQIIAAVTLSGPAPAGGINIPLGLITKAAFDNPPAGGAGGPQVNPIPFGINVPANATTGQIQLMSAIAAESSYIICLYDPTNNNDFKFALLTIT